MSSVEESVSLEAPEAAPAAATEVAPVAVAAFPAAALAVSAEAPEAVADAPAPGAAQAAAPEAAVAATAEAPELRKKVVLRSVDGAEFEVEESETASSDTISHLIGQGCLDGPVPLPNVSAAGLGLVVDYWKTHSAGTREEEWYKKFMAMGRDDLFEMIMTANYLSDRPLLDLICQAVADTIKDMTAEEVRDYFDMDDDFTTDEVRALREYSLWAFD